MEWWCRMKQTFRREGLIKNPYCTYSLCKQLVYNQPALEWQIVKQFSELDPFLLSNNKNYKFKNIGISPM